MIIRFTNEKGLPDSLFFSDKDMEQNPYLIDDVIRELWDIGCDDFYLWNPTWEEMIKEIKELHKSLKCQAKNFESTQKLVNWNFQTLINSSK